jgi:hypothetical protein
LWSKGFMNWKKYITPLSHSKTMHVSYKTSYPSFSSSNWRQIWNERSKVISVPSRLLNCPTWVSDVLFKLCLLRRITQRHWRPNHVILLFSVHPLSFSSPRYLFTEAFIHHHPTSSNLWLLYSQLLNYCQAIKYQYPQSIRSSNFRHNDNSSSWQTLHSCSRRSKSTMITPCP